MPTKQEWLWRWMPYVLPLASLAVALTLSYLFALAGEPQSNWLWCTVLRVCGT
jgi:hypothetical protein